MKRMMTPHFQNRTLRKAFSLVEILASLAILTFGLLAMLSLLQRTLQKSEPIEFLPRAAILAESIAESIRSHPQGGMPFIPGMNPPTWPALTQNPYGSDTLLMDYNGKTYDPSSNKKGFRLPFVFSLPGNGVDDDLAILTKTGDRNWADAETVISASQPVSGVFKYDYIANPDGIDDTMHRALVQNFGNLYPAKKIASLRDFDGRAQQEICWAMLAGNSPQYPFINPDDDYDDTDGDGIPRDTGDSGVFIGNSYNPFFYNNLFGVGQTAAYRPDGDFAYDPQRGIDEEISDGRDNDGDGLIDEDLALATQVRLGGDPTNSYHLRPLLAGNGIDDDGDAEDGKSLETRSPRDPITKRIMADGIDNDGDGKVDEGIDEEIYNGRDDDGDSRIDEDCQGSYIPWQPIPLPSPNDAYSFRIMVRRIALGGDGVDNDGDAFLRPGIAGFDDDDDGKTDLIGERAVDEEFFDGADNDISVNPALRFGDGLIDEDLRSYPSPKGRLITVFIYQGDDRQDNDGDGWIDEEAEDGIDNDLDGQIDEDIYKRVYSLTFQVQLPEETQK